MDYAIIRNDKLTRVHAKGSYIHNDRMSKGYSNKDIDLIQEHIFLTSGVRKIKR